MALLEPEGLVSQLMSNWMIEQKKQSPDDSFRIVSISSISSYTSSPSRGEYCVSKAGISMMTKLYADRLAEYNIGVFEISNIGGNVEMGLFCRGQDEKEGIITNIDGLSVNKKI